MNIPQTEKDRQEAFPWSRSTYHSDYNHYLAYYKVKSCLEHARGNSLLDIACGDGLMTESFAKHFTRVVGVDASGKHLAVARERVSQAEFHESLIEEFEIQERFDSIFMLDLLEHVIDPVAVLKKAAGFLADDGILIVHVPNAYAVNRRIAAIACLARNRAAADSASTTATALPGSASPTHVTTAAAATARTRSRTGAPGSTSATKS